MAGKSKFWSMHGLHKPTGLRFESGLERKFLDQCYMLGIKVKRCQHKVQYKDSAGKVRTYEPDFELSDFNWVIEIKGKWAVRSNHAYVKEKYQAAMAKFNGRYSVMTEIELRSGYLTKLYVELFNDRI